MRNDETNNLQPEHDPFTIGELISLQQAAEYAGLTKDTLHNYAKRNRNDTAVRVLPTRERLLTRHLF